MPRFDPQTCYVSDLIEWHERGELELAPKFQRRAVWSLKMRSYLMDTIIRGLPIPKVFMRHEVDVKTKKVTRQIIDGQQRIRAILDFVDDGFSISTIHNKEFGGRYYSELPEGIQQDMLSYKIGMDVLLGSSDAEVLDIFARLNTYTVVLNKQELLNAKYFGDFKQTVYALGYEFVDFLQANEVLAHRDVIRMAEAELASELVIQIIAGIQPRNAIESFYKKYDDELPAKEEIMDRFRAIMDMIAEIIGERLSSSNFSNTPLFYSLFGVLYDLKYGMVDMEGTPRDVDKRYYPKISVALDEIDSILETKVDELDSEYFEFYDASTKHVTDLTRRQFRHNFIKIRMQYRMYKDTDTK